jgi:hypothetical protein
MRTEFGIIQHAFHPARRGLPWPDRDRRRLVDRHRLDRTGHRPARSKHGSFGEHAQRDRRKAAGSQPKGSIECSRRRSLRPLLFQPTCPGAAARRAWPPTGREGSGGRRWPSHRRAAERQPPGGFDYPVPDERIRHRPGELLARQAGRQACRLTLDSVMILALLRRPPLPAAARKASAARRPSARPDSCCPVGRSNAPTRSRRPTTRRLNRDRYAPHPQPVSLHGVFVPSGASSYRMQNDGIRRTNLTGLN